MAEKYIDIGAIKKNAADITEKADLIAVVKADAYGHGALRVSRALENYVSGFAVANIQEADNLVKGGIKKDIIVFGTTLVRPKNNNIIRTFSDSSELASLGKNERVAVKIDTGMHRYGADPNEAKKLIEKLESISALHSVYTHLRCPSDAAITEKQFKLFDECTANTLRPKHVAASRAVDSEIARSTGIVRCGIALYGGISPFKQAMSIFGKVCRVTKVRAGEGAGYGNGTFKRDMTVAVLDIGYADGYRRTNKERCVFLRGKRRKVLAVCMDCTISEADDEVCAGEYAEFLGDHISADELSATWDTDPYELFTTFGRLINPHYTGETDG